jgi:hypothetical protein
MLNGIEQNIKNEDNEEQICRINNSIVLYRKKLQELVQSLENLKKERVFMEKFSPFLKGEKYFYVNEKGEINSRFWDNKKIDDWNYYQSNFFATMNGAQRWKKYVKIKKWIKNISEKLNNKDPQRTLKYVIVYSLGEHNFFLKEVMYNTDNSLICYSNKFLDVCLEQIGFKNMVFYYTYERA